MHCISSCSGKCGHRTFEYTERELKYIFIVFVVFCNIVDLCTVWLSSNAYCNNCETCSAVSNVFAAVLHAVADWLRGQFSRFIWLSACAVIVFRAELAILLGLFAIESLVQRRLTFSCAIKNAVMSSLVWLG